MPEGTLLRRYAIARAALAIGACMMLVPLSQIDVVWVLTIVVLALASIGVVYLVQDRGRQALAVVGGDIALGLVMIPVTGAEGSPFLPLLYMAVIFAGTHRSVRAGVITAIVGAVGLHAALFTAAAPFDNSVTLATRLDALWGSRETIVRLYSAVGFLALIGALAGYVGRALRRRDMQLERARKELQQRRLDTDTIVESLSTGLISVTSEGRIALINQAACRTLGLPELPPDRTASRVLSGRLEEVGAVLQESLESGEGRNRATITLERTETDVGRLIGLSTVPVRMDREVVGVVGIFRDITDIRAEEQEARRKDRLASIGEVAAGIVHELRNILKPLSGTVELLEGDVQGDPTRLEQVRLIRHECDALEAFLEEILEFAGDAPLDVDRHEARALVERVVSRVVAHPEAARAEVRFECPDGVVLEGDGGALGRMLQNLVMNSIQVGPAGTVVVSVNAEPGSVRLRVADDGPGIDRAVQERMFEPFFTTRSGGTGLGLAVAKRTVERHGGTIRAHNAEGGGAVFEVTLPSLHAESAAHDMAA